MSFGGNLHVRRFTPVELVEERTKPVRVFVVDPDGAFFSHEQVLSHKKKKARKAVSLPGREVAERFAK